MTFPYTSTHGQGVRTLRVNSMQVFYFFDAKEQHVDERIYVHPDLAKVVAVMNDRTVFMLAFDLEESIEHTACYLHRSSFRYWRALNGVV